MLIYCSRCQRYKFLKAIHNTIAGKNITGDTVHDVKDTNFWKQFTTTDFYHIEDSVLFTMSKIQIFESNSQQVKTAGWYSVHCSRCQRYKFLKAIHNHKWIFILKTHTVHDVKDTNFWKQFTTGIVAFVARDSLFTMSKIQIFESNSQLKGEFTVTFALLFTMSKIQIFESNSQLSSLKN